MITPEFTDFSNYSTACVTHKSARLDLTTDGGSRVELSGFRAEIPGEGHGGSLLREVCTWADQEGKELHLEVGSSDQELIAFYERHGFKIRDTWSTRCRVYMVRKVQEMITPEFTDFLSYSTARVAYKSARLNLTACSKSCRVDLSGFCADEPERGHGGGLLREVCDWADREGKELHLEAGSSDPDRFSDQDLIAFYERHGFKIKGSDTGWSTCMVRK